MSTTGPTNNIISTSTTSPTINTKFTSTTSPTVNSKSTSTTSPIINTKSMSVTSPTINTKSTSTTSLTVNTKSTSTTSPTVNTKSKSTTSPIVNIKSTSTTSPTVNTKSTSTTGPTINTKSTSTTSPTVSSKSTSTTGPTVNTKSTSTTSPTVNTTLFTNITTSSSTTKETEKAEDVILEIAFSLVKLRYAFSNPPPVKFNSNGWPDKDVYDPVLDKCFGKNFIHTHRQLLARYYAERLCLGIKKVTALPDYFYTSTRTILSPSILGTRLIDGGTNEEFQTPLQLDDSGSAKLALDIETNLHDYSHKLFAYMMHPYTIGYPPSILVGACAGIGDGIIKSMIYF
ncbi:8042_t:CDS:2 [Racocetra persica]|uniref:8042_t:CDS:1 n=1 Tax=Racocetra persica TaxID=160502 RepID=A0ACA9KSK4_9GLOM|nr:8042_t:CDS:2 [Racocetra persica]